MRNYKDNLCECPLWMHCIHYQEGECGLKGVDLSLCPSCNCMTKTIRGRCGKCGELK